MQNTTPNLITPEQFNEKVRGWTISVRQRMAANAPVSSGADSPFRKEEHLKGSIKHLINITDGAASRIKFEFARHGVFVHYGAGRGYGGTKGTTWKNRLGFMKKTSIASRGKMGSGRQAVNWFDNEIEHRYNELGDIVQNFYGDWVLEDMLSKFDRLTIGKK